MPLKPLKIAAAVDGWKSAIWAKRLTEEGFEFEGPENLVADGSGRIFHVLVDRPYASKKKSLTKEATSKTRLFRILKELQDTYKDGNNMSDRFQSLLRKTREHGFCHCKNCRLRNNWSIEDEAEALALEQEDDRSKTPPKEN